MKNEKAEQKSITKIAFEKCKKSAQGLSWHLCFFAFVTILCLCLGYVAPDTIFLSIPFLVIPAFFSFLSNNACSEFAPNRPTSSFAMFRMYFSRLFFGVFRIITDFFKALLAFVISTTACGLVAGIFIFPANDEYVAFIEGLDPEISFSDLFTEYGKFALNNESFMRVMSIIAIVSLAVATVEFIHQISKNSIKLFFNLTTNIPMLVPQLTIVHKEVMKSNKKEFFKEYFKATWFLHLLLIIGLSCGYLLNFLVIGSGDLFEGLVLSLAAALIFTLPLMNYYSHVLTTIYLKFSSSYAESFVSSSLKIFEKFKNTNELTQEEKQAIEKAINDAKEKLEKDKQTTEEENKKSHE